MRYLFLVSLLFITGCQSKDVLYFGTYTRVGVDASTDGGGIGVKNAAFNITPQQEDGNVFSVLGTSDIDVSYFDTVINEVFAVGDAAKCASSKIALADPQDALGISQQSNSLIKPIVFATYSSWSLVDLSFGNATAVGINFGYKRGTGVKMNVVNGKVGSVYSSTSVNTTSNSATENIAPKSNISGTRNKHVFATGDAALIKASQEAPKLNGGDSNYQGCLNLQ